MAPNPAPSETMKFLVVREVARQGAFARGAQGGQAAWSRGAGRELRPEDQVDEIVDHYPVACHWPWAQA